jgi:hypothetical protein
MKNNICEIDEATLVSLELCGDTASCGPRASPGCKCPKLKTIGAQRAGVRFITLKFDPDECKPLFDRLEINSPSTRIMTIANSKTVIQFS